MAFSDSAVSSRGSALAEINITPLVDVMLVLLVIFMVTAPMLTRSINLSLPQPTPETVITKPLQLRLEVAADGTYRLDDRPLSLADLRQRLEEASVSDPKAVLSVETASDADYQPVVAALAAARNGGLTHISIR
ncbi:MULTISPECIES: biopolymer transporter ExbD [unclassified Pseudoxanthomonas]|uniref:ExbD/TolR family protein n=1 Tax=unclassified Pseudoxanthomonas TaxID=2645906 RepID=UPI0030783350